METGAYPYETLVLVCTNKREGGERPSCAGEGRCGAALRDKLKAAVAARGLKAKVRVSASGCLDVCEEGPNVLVLGPDGKKKLFHRVSETDAPVILESIVRGA